MSEKDHNLKSFTLMVNEIFYSIQGESSWAGLPCAFVRLSGCPLRCRWCDTSYAWEEGREMSLERILARVEEHQAPLVELTGGEPLAQKNSLALLSALCSAERTVLLETSGALSIAPVDQRVHIIMDIKCPSSGMSHRMHWPNLEQLKKSDEVKLVLADEEDYRFARRVIKEHDLAARCGVLISTVHGSIEARQVVEWILADRLPVRFQLQMHKYIWPPEKRGV